MHQHPGIFMAKKELHHFGSDLNINPPSVTAEEYLNEFKDGAGRAILGESSVWYLFSTLAAHEIKAFAPDAKIIIMLRNPVEMIPALHRQNLVDANEDITDFEKALGATEDRRAGKRLPKNLELIACLMYTEAAKYYRQVKRYLDVFGSNVHVIIYDDFKKDNLKVYSAVLRFLQIDDGFVPAMGMINTAKKLRNQQVQRLLKRPPTGLRSVVRTLMPFKPVRRFIMQQMEKYNVQIGGSQKLSEPVKQVLKEMHKDDIKQLSALLQRDLNFWVE